MLYYLLVALPLLGASSISGTKPPHSNPGDVARSPGYNGRVSGGSVADIEEFPYMASYHYGDKGDDKYLCSAAIVSHQYLVTAAHCVQGVSDPSIIKLRMGSADRTEGKLVKVLDIIMNPNYTDPSHELNLNFDVALLKTERIDFSDKVQPVTLPKSGEDLPMSLTVSGWGTTGLGGTKPSHLMASDLDLLDKTICLAVYYRITEETFCAGGINKGLCDGDEGDPAVEQTLDDNLDNKNILHGIALYQRGCGLGYNEGIFLQVSAPPIHHFITKNIGK